MVGETKEAARSGSQSTDEKPQTWSSTQAYVMAVICLLVGAAIGYLLNAPKQTAVAQAQVTAGMPSDDPHAGMQITPEQLKQMADKKAAPLLEELKKNPNDAKVLSELGTVYEAAHQFPEAAQYYEKSAAAKPDANTLTELASTYYYAGSTEKALSTLNRALQVDPKFANALFNLGMLEWQVKGDAKGAIQTWQKLLKSNPNHPKKAEVEHLIEQAKKHMDGGPMAAAK